MDNEWEAMLADAEKKLLTLSLVDLRAVSEELGLSPSETAKSSCRLLSRLILSHLESEEVTGLEDAGMSVLLATYDFIDNLKREPDEAGGDRASASNGETSAQPEIVMEHPMLAENDTTRQPALSPQRPGSLTSSERESAPTRSQVNLHPMYRKDFRIIGQIGEVGQKDKLNFTSLERQI